MGYFSKRLIAFLSTFLAALLITILVQISGAYSEWYNPEGSPAPGPKRYRGIGPVEPGLNRYPLGHGMLLSTFTFHRVLNYI